MQRKRNRNFILTATVGTAMPSAYVGDTVSLLLEKKWWLLLIETIPVTHPEYQQVVYIIHNVHVPCVIVHKIHYATYVELHFSHRFHFLYRHTEVCGN